MKSGSVNNPPRKLRYFTGSLSIKPFAFSKGLQTTKPIRRTATEFIEQTRIEVMDGSAPFRLWEGQKQALHTMEHERLAVFLKARQLGISWVACGFSLYALLTSSNQTVLAYSQGQLEANELIRRVAFLYHQHAHQQDLPQLITDNIGALAWSNGSRMLSLAATRKAGRSFTANIALLDEWAFMSWPRQTLAAVKPTIDAGGKLFIISSADGMGSAYHQLWQQAQNGENGYKAVFLPWFAHPDRGPDWRDQKIVEASGDTASVLREYPANDLEAFTAATDAIFGVWSDGPADGNVTEYADYIEDGGGVLWFVDDGYVGKRDPATGQWTADSHPRVFLLAQLRPDGTINVFAESDAVGILSDTHITNVMTLPLDRDQVLALAASIHDDKDAHSTEYDKVLAAVRKKHPKLFYPHPDFAVVDKSAAELKGRMHAESIYTRNSPSDVEESIKELRRALAPDKNGRRRVKVHPRCKNLRAEMVSYRRDANGKIVKAYDHSIDALRYGVWTQRYEV